MNKSYKTKKKMRISEGIIGVNQIKSNRDLYIFNVILKNFKMKL